MRRLRRLAACRFGSRIAKLGGLRGIERKLRGQLLRTCQLESRRIGNRLTSSLLRWTAGRGTGGCLRCCFRRTTVAGYPADAGCRTRYRTLTLGHEMKSPWIDQPLRTERGNPRAQLCRNGDGRKCQVEATSSDEVPAS